jgi:hypothetical protein
MAAVARLLERARQEAEKLLAERGGARRAARGARRASRN